VGEPNLLIVTGCRPDTGAVDCSFEGRIIEWRGPAPYYYVPVPEPEAADIHEVAAFATYGWGVVPVEARIDDVTFTTSLFPQDGGYLLPLKDAVRRTLGLDEGDRVAVELTVRLER
jgi:hypothetical protein